MGKRDSAELLEEIGKAATDIISYADGHNSKTFDVLPLTDGRTYRAIKNALAEIGEAVKNLPKENTDRHPNIDWRGLSGLRDIVAHQYFRIDMDQVWLVITDELPDLIAAIHAEQGFSRSIP